VVEEIAYDEPNKHSQQSQLRRLAGGRRRRPWALNRTPVAPPWRRDRSLEKAAEMRAAILGFERRASGICW
jgi:hypothetical protein